MASEIFDSKEEGFVRARISGVMVLADQMALEAVARRLIDAGQKISLLVTLDDFKGWEKNEAWGEDLQFQHEYGNEVARIAIVGDERWKDQVLLFVGKGFRDTQIEFFPTGSLDIAKAWLRR